MPVKEAAGPMGRLRARRLHGLGWHREDDAVDIDSVRCLVDWTVEAGSAGMLILAVVAELAAAADRL